jgi:Rrf2 family protein
MLALALHHGQGPLMVKDIAVQQHLPATYLEQLMVLLRKASLVTATRGAHGGYLLARPAVEITLAEIIEVLEGPLALTECPSGAGCCGHAESCALREIWDEASAALLQVFAGITLANLVERQRAKEEDPVLMYNI